MVELWAYTSAYAARLADGLGSNPSAGTNHVDVTRKARERIANPFYAGSIPVTYSMLYLYNTGWQNYLLMYNTHLFFKNLLLGSSIG